LKYTPAQILQAIGENADDDYILSPSSHKDRYQETIPELAALFDREILQHIYQEYEQEDQKAIYAQKRYRRFSKLARRATFLTTIFSVTLIMAGTLKGIPDFLDPASQLPDIALRASAILAIVFGGMASALIMLIKGEKMLEKWMKHRAAAEEERISFFETMAELVNDRSAEIQLIVLEYFRRYQLDMQIAYYTIRSGQLERKANRTVLMLAIAGGLVIIVNGITGILGAEWAVVGSLALIIQAYTAMVSNRENSDQNERNALRYAGVRRQLSALKARLPEIRQKLMTGSGQILLKCMKAVHEPMATEHRQWLETMRGTSAAMNDLEESLAGIPS